MSLLVHQTKPFLIDDIWYETNNLGVVKQLNPEIISYDKDYLAGLIARPNYDQNAIKLATLRINLLKGTCNFNSLVDFGYGDGVFLHHLNQENTFGYDIGPYPDPPLPAKRIKNLHSADVYTFFDSLEHLPNIDIISSIETKFIMVSLPQCPKTIEEFKIWRHRKPNEHIWHFNKGSLINFMEFHNYTPLHISNIEDTVRGGPNNILTGIFKC